jgi:hypothetical protein
VFLSNKDGLIKRVCLEAYTPAVQVPMQYYHARRNLDFSSPSSSPLESPIYGVVAPDEQLDTKVQLRNRLNSGRLSNMPAGFPFRHVMDPRGTSHISYDPYEFREELRSESRCGGNLAAHVSFMPENADTRPYRSKKDYLSWCAHVPKLDLRPYTRGPPREFLYPWSIPVLNGTTRSKSPHCPCARRHSGHEHSLRKIYRAGPADNSSCSFHLS